MKAMPWKEYEAAVHSKKDDDINIYHQKMINTLVPFIIMEPTVSPSSSSHCQQPPALLPQKDLDCSAFPTGLNGTRREEPAKVAHLIQLGFDVDTLEILFHELDDLVDYFFIIESTTTHNKALHKPLIWEQIKRQPRFEKFVTKTIHLILDDADVLAALDEDSVFSREHLQEKIIWQSFLSWNHYTNYFGPEDLLGFGDPDEIPSRDNLHLLRHCHMKGSSIDIATWFAWARIDQAFASDWPVPHHPYTYGDPSYFTLASAQAKKGLRPPTRLKGLSGSYLLGGIHMSDHSYLPYLFLKLITCTECADEFLDYFPSLQTHLMQPTHESIRELELSLQRSRGFEKRMIDPKELLLLEEEKAIVYYPWYYKCNTAMYPMWEYKHDTRLDL